MRAHGTPGGFPSSLLSPRLFLQYVDSSNDAAIARFDLLCTLVDSIISFDLLDALVNSVFVSANSWLLIRRSHCLQCLHRTDMNRSLVAYARYQFLIDNRWASSCATIASALGTVWTRTVDCCFDEATAYEVASCQRRGSLVAYLGIDF